MHTSFTGVLLLPETSAPGTTSVVTDADGRPIATLRHRSRTARTRFEILDPAGDSVLATGALASLWGPKYELMGPDAEFLLQLKFGWAGLGGTGTVTLPDGRTLCAKGDAAAGRFTMSDRSGTPVAELLLAGPQRAGLEFDLRAPVLTTLQAIGLAQLVRTVVEATTTAAAAA